MKPTKEENRFSLKSRKTIRNVDHHENQAVSLYDCAHYLLHLFTPDRNARSNWSRRRMRSFVRNSVRWALLKWELVVARLTIGRWGEGVVVGELPSSVWRTADAFLKEFHHPLPSAPLPLHLKTRALPLCSASSRFEFNPKTTSGC